MWGYLAVCRVDLGGIKGVACWVTFLNERSKPGVLPPSINYIGIMKNKMGTTGIIGFI